MCRTAGRPEEVMLLRHTVTDIFRAKARKGRYFMKKHFKKAAAAVLAGLLTAGLLAGCGGGGAASSDGGNGSGDSTTITVFNSKMEIQEQLETKAAE